MSLNREIWQAAAGMGQYLTDAPDSEFKDICEKCFSENGFFEPVFVLKALRNIGRMLSYESLSQAFDTYNISAEVKKRVGLILPSNIPAVGFHDALVTILMGHQALIKPGSGDQVLIFYLLQLWQKYCEHIAGLYVKVDKIHDADAYLITGSDNTARHFKYYLGHKPHIIRGNRTSVAILTGNEPIESLKALADDIFSYFGLGCRNVTQLLLPLKYDLSLLANAWSDYAFIINNHKYANNYRYQHTLSIMNRYPMLDGGFYLLQQSEALFAPVSVVNYTYYHSMQEAMDWVQQRLDKIQCFVGDWPSLLNPKPFGMAQSPDLLDFADGKDTFEFLKNLHTSAIVEPNYN